MQYRTRIQYTESQKAEMWDRWQRGESLHQIAQLFDRYHTSVRGIIAASGGIRPPSRRRAASALSLAEREEISRGIALSHSIRAIACGLSRAPSTISREIRRNCGPAQYRATVADQAAWRRASRPKPCKLGQHDRLAREVPAKLQKQWCPEQIAGWLKRTYPDDPTGVARNNLSHVVHPISWRAQEGVARPSTSYPGDAAFSSPYAENG